MKYLRPLLLITIAVFICLVAGCREIEKPMPVAEAGVLDLSGWDPTRDGPVALNGSWEFYWDRLLTPEDFMAEGTPQIRSGYLTFPGFWKKYELNGQPLPGTGQATFRLRILPGPGVRELTLRLYSIWAAYQIWANGKLVATSGVVGRSDADETPDRSLVMATLTSDGKPIDLVMQISNHYFVRGGVQNPILLSASGPLERTHMNKWGWGLLFVGCLLIMALYHIILYSLRRKDISTLYFGIYCIVLAVIFVSIDSTDWLVRFFVPDIEFMTVSKMALLSFAVSTSILYRFYRALFPREFGRLLLYVIDIRGALFVITILSQSGTGAHVALQLFALTAPVATMCFIVLLSICLRRGYSGSLVLLCGLLALGITSLHDIYYLIFSTNMESLISVGWFALILSQAIALAQRFSKSFVAVENLSERLESKNVKLEEEIAERTRLEREIVNVSEEERRRISIDIHDGLCQQLTGACLRCAALSGEGQGATGKNDELEQLSAILDAMVNQAYDLSCGIWPLESEAAGTGPSLEDMVQRYSRSSGISMEFRDERGCEICRNMQVTQLYRIAQEAIANAIKHANPTKIVVSFGCASNGMVTLQVRDDGVGRSAAAQSKGGLGMNIMAHRAMMIGGDFQVVDIDEIEGGGTMVACSVMCLSGAHEQHNEEKV